MRARQFGAAIGILIVLAGCGAEGTSTLQATRYGTPSAGPSQGGSVPASSASTPSGAPSAQPSATVTATPAPAIPPLSLVRVTVATLNVRVAPSASAKLIEPATGLPVTLPLTSGTHLLVLSGPVPADGYAWYAVGLPLDPSLTTAQVPVGWVAGASGGTPWLARDTSGCPAPNVTALAPLTGVERVGCFGSSSLSFSARQTAEAPDAGLGGTCGAAPDQPGWLLCDNVNYSWVNADGGTSGLLLLHFDPATGIAPTNLAPPSSTGPAYRITGHFDDPAAQGCGDATDPANLDQMSAWLTCAAEFVVEKLTTT